MFLLYMLRHHPIILGVGVVALLGTTLVLYFTTPML